MGRNGHEYWLHLALGLRINKCEDYGHRTELKCYKLQQYRNNTEKVWSQKGQSVGG